LQGSSLDGVGSAQASAKPLAAKDWAALRDHLRDELGLLRTAAWLDLTRPRGLDDSTLWVEVDKGEPREALWALRSEVEEVLGEHFGRRLRLRLSSPSARRAARAKAPADEEPFELRDERTLARHDLASFITGPTNRLAAEFARQAVRTPGEWHPLVYYGQPGSGKTHLLQGILNGYRRRYPARRAVYVRADRFAQQFSQAMRRRRARSFRDHYREASLLVLDDLERIAGKRKSEQELSHTLDHLLMSGRATQVVVASRAVPKDIPQLLDGLAGRLLGGQLVQLPEADRATRRSVLRASCLRQGLSVPPAVEELLTAKAELSIHELLVAVTRLAAHRTHIGAQLDLGSARRILRDLLSGRREVATLAGIASFVASETGVSEDHLLGRSRQPRVVQARHLAIGIARALTPCTLREVGAFFGGRSVASVHEGQAKATKLRESQQQAQSLWEAAERRFEPAEDLS